VLYSQMMNRIKYIKQMVMVERVKRKFARLGMRKVVVIIKKYMKRKGSTVNSRQLL